MSIFLLLIPFVGTFLGFWIVWRLVSIDQPETLPPRDTTWDPPHHYRCRCKVATLPTQARARGVVLPKDFVGPTYRNTRPSGPHFWSEEEP